MLVAASLSVVPLAGSEQPAPGTIAGTIRDSVTRAAIPAAAVSLVDVAAGAQRIAATSTADGSFTLSGVDPTKQYFLQVSAAGYQNGGLGQWSGPTFNGPHLRLAAGETLSNLEVLIDPWGTVSGMVTAEAGGPVVSAAVRVIEQIVAAGVQHFAAGPIAYTDDQGRFRIPKIGPGRYFIVVPTVQTTVPFELTRNQETQNRRPLATGDRGAVQAFGPGIRDMDDVLILGNYPVVAPVAGRLRAYPAASAARPMEGSASSSFDLSVGERRAGLNISLAPVGCVSVAGSMTGTSELEGFMLRLIPEGSEDLGVGAEQATTFVKKDGKFRFLCVPEGRYTLLGRQIVSEYLRGTPLAVGLPPTPGWEPGVATARVVTTARPGTQLATKASNRRDVAYVLQTIEVGRDPVARLSLSASPLLTISGSIVLENTTAREVSIVAEAASGEAWKGLPTARVEVKEGRASFQISGLATGKYWLRIQTPGLLLKRETLVDVQGTDVALPEPLAATGQSAGVLGTVPSGFANRASVVFLPADPQLHSAFGLAPPAMRSIPVDRDDTFTITGLPAGTYFVVAVDHLPPDWATTDTIKRLSNAAQRVQLEWGQTTTVNPKLSSLR